MLTDLPPGHRPAFRRAACLVVDRGRLLLAEPAESADHRPGSPLSRLPSAVVAPGHTARRAAARAAARALGRRVAPAQLAYLAELHVPPDPVAAYDLRIFRYDAPARADHPPRHRWLALDRLADPDPDADGAAGLGLGLDPDTRAWLLAATARPTDAPDIAGIEARARRLVGPLPAAWHTETPTSIVVLGPPAVGKTTLLNRYAAQTPHVEHVRDIIPVSRGPGRDNHLTRYLRGDTSSAFFCQMETLLLRTLQHLRTGRTRVLDQDVHSSLAYAKALRLNGDVSSREYETYYRYHHLVASALPPPAAVVHLTASTDVLMRRMRRRDRVLERTFAHSYVALVAQCFEDVAEELSASVPVHHIDASALRPDEVLDRFRPLVAARTPLPPIPATPPEESPS
ncbi:deoxynucleoside kinase [Embleya sp. AB8]|uniref:deoxynucleoside kinase n=1 Tax=Embleya sp. AB8 TaxID=3156304 RepID=UPI003C74DFFE